MCLQQHDIVLDTLPRMCTLRTQVFHDLIWYRREWQYALVLLLQYETKKGCNNRIQKTKYAVRENSHFTERESDHMV